MFLYSSIILVYLTVIRNFIFIFFIGHVSLGGLGDSFYEYLLKAFIQSNGKDSVARDMFDDAMASVMDNLVQTSSSGLTYLADMRFDRLEHKMDHLSCFAGKLCLNYYKLTIQNLACDHHKPYYNIIVIINNFMFFSN